MPTLDAAPASSAPKHLVSDAETQPIVAALGNADPRTLRILAKTIHRELRQSGLEPSQIVSVSGELLDLVAADLRERRGEPGAR